MTRRSIAATSDAPERCADGRIDLPSSREELHEPVADRGGELALGPLPEWLVLAGTREDRGAVRLGAEPHSLPTDLVRDEQVDALACELVPAARFDVIRLGGESDQDAFAGLSRQLAEDVGCRDQPKMWRPVLFLDLGSRGPLGTEVGDGGSHDDRVGSLSGVEHGVTHLVGGCDPNDAGGLGGPDPSGADDE